MRAYRPGALRFTSDWCSRKASLLCLPSSDPVTAKTCTITVFWLPQDWWEDFTLPEPLGHTYLHA